jgi:hypothetical protein
MIVAVYLANESAEIESRTRRLEETTQSLAALLARLEVTLNMIPTEPDQTLAPNVQYSSVLVNRFYPDTSLRVTDSPIPLPSLIYSLVSEGNFYVAGSAMFSGDVSFYIPEEDEVVTLQDLVRAVARMNKQGECALSECENAGIVGGECECVCIGDTWSGETCETNTCAGHGTWNNITGQCVCDDFYDPGTYCQTPLCINGIIDGNDVCVCDYGYIGTACQNGLPTCAETCQGKCIGGICVCEDFMMGANCQYNCTAGGIHDGRCFFQLENTGYDICRSLHGRTVCYCGGGYEATGTDLLLKSALCDNCEIEDIDMSTCCAPGVVCASTYECTTDTCCAGIDEQIDCLSAGCLWCDTGYCGLEMFDTCSGNISAGSPVQWSSSVLNCSTESLFPDECSAYTRAEYLSIYDYFSGSVDSNKKAREYINSIEWPMRQIANASEYGKTFYLEVLDETLIAEICAGKRSFLGVVEKVKYTSADVLGIVCLGADAQLFTLDQQPPVEARYSVGMNLVYLGSSGYSCIAPSMSTQPAKMAAFTMASTKIPSDAALGISLTAHSFGVEIMRALCEDVYVDLNTHTIGSSTSVLSVSPIYNILHWSTVGTPLQVRPIRHIV